jgi:hypothetical protein
MDFPRSLPFLGIGIIHHMWGTIRAFQRRVPKIAKGIAIMRSAATPISTNVAI